MWMATTTTSSPSSTKPSMMASSSPLSVTSSSLHPMPKNSSRNSRWVGCPSLFFVSVVFCQDDIYIYIIILFVSMTRNTCPCMMGLWLKLVGRPNSWSSMHLCRQTQLASRSALLLPRFSFLFPVWFLRNLIFITWGFVCILL